MKEADKCGHCGSILPSGHKGPCPRCGKSEKMKTLHVTVGGVLLSTGSIAKLSIVKEYYKKHPEVMIQGILITLGISSLGFFLGGYVGAIIGCLLSLAYFLGGQPYRTHHKDTERR